MNNKTQTLLEHPLILPVYVPSLIFAFCQGLLIPILPLYATEFDVSYALIGLFLAAGGLGQLAGNIPAGVLLRRIGQKNSMLLGISGAGLLIAGLVWANSIAAAFVYYLLAGFCIAIFNISRHVYLADTVAVAGRGRAIALFGGINRIGKFLAPAAGGIVAGIFGLRSPFLLFGGACLLAFILIVIFVHDVPNPTQLAKGQMHHLFNTLRNNYKLLGVAGAGQIFAQMIRRGRDIIIPLFASDVLGLEVQQIGFIMSVGSGIDMTLFYPAGMIMDRLGRKFAIVPSFAIQTLGMALIPLTSGFFSLLLVSGLIGFGNGLGSGTMMTISADLAPDNARGEFLGVWRFIGDVGASAAPIIVGGVAGLVALPTAALVMSGAGLIAVVIFAFFVPETLKKQIQIVTAAK